MKKINLLLFIIFFSFFVCLINVEAQEESLYCKYEVEYLNNVATLIISYPDESGAVKVEKKQDTINPNVSINFGKFPDTIADIKVRDTTNNYKLICPTIYYNFRTEAGGQWDRRVSYIYDSFFSDDPKRDDDSKILPLVDSNVINDETINPEEEYKNEILTTCVYNDNSGKAFSMSIFKDNSLGSPSLYGSYSNYRLNLLLFGTYSDCPDKLYRACGYGYCSIDSEYQSGQQTTLILAGGETDSGGTDPNLVATYLLYNDSKSPKIKVGKDDVNGGYKVYTDNGTVTISNLNEFTSEFSSGNSDKYPTYILVSGSGNDAVYQFATKSNPNVAKVYMLKDHILKVSGIGQSALKKTCRSIIGDNFLTFLNNNVFKFVYIAIPIILIVLTTVDFAKVVFIDDKEGIQGAFKKFGKRVAAAVLIYLVPNILIFTVNLIGADEVEQCAQALKNIAESENSN